MIVILDLAIKAALLSTLSLVAGFFLYALGSFLLMAAYTSRRSFGLTFRELFREGLFVLLTQPLLPFFYVFGRKMHPGAGVPIVFVHGYMQNRVDFVGLARALGRRGLGPMFGFNYPWFWDIASNAARLERFVAGVCKETGAHAVDVVCHSLGGLVAVEMMRGEARAEELKVRRCVTIATPHAGVAWRGPIFGVGGASLRRGSKLLEAHAGTRLAVPCLSIYSTHDNVVHPKETSMLAKRGGLDVEVEGLSHLAILFSPVVAEHVATFLAEPDPVPTPEGARPSPEA